MEQLNIVGKRSGDGFVAHKNLLADTLARAIASRLTVLDCTIGRKGFVSYIKSLSGSNVVKIVPAAQANGKTPALKVLCGNHASTIEDGAWLGDKTPWTIAGLQISPANVVAPNIGAGELADAIARVLPFTATDDARPVLRCVKFEAASGKLLLVGADGFRLAIASLDCEAGEGEALIDRDDLASIPAALARARRARVSIADGTLAIETDAIRYGWQSHDGKFPDFERLIPTGASTHLALDTIETLKAIRCLATLAAEKVYAIDLAIGEGKVTASNPDDKGVVEIPAAIEGEAVRIRLDGAYLSQAMRACGGIVDVEIVNHASPILFTRDGYKLVTMPMLCNVPKPAAAEAKAEAVDEAEAVAAEAVDEATPEAPESKGRRGRKHDRQPVAV